MPINIGEYLMSAIADVTREDAMRERFAGQPFIPDSLKDAAECDASRAYMARDAGGNLHLIGSDQKRKE